MSVRANVDKANLVAQIQAMEQRFRDAIRPASYAGALVYYSEVKMHVPRDSGLLADSIYMVHSEDNSTPGMRETYHVSWNKKKAPHGHLLEFGTSRMAARPFLRPAYEAAKGRAQAEIMKTFREHMDGSADHRGNQ
ncbi:MAG: hypothetical protein GXY45_11765 [Ramlibacter sp.]|nr:hypothetical protein [Ramlibacter sp.]